jgi:deoxyribodipyrimidine photo-lyase
MVGVVWFRRDLRLADNFTIQRAFAECKSVYGIFVMDPVVLRRAGSRRLSYLLGALSDLKGQMQDRLIVAYGDPAKVLLDLCDSVEAKSVYVSRDVSHYSKWRDQRVREALLGRSVAFIEVDYPTTFPLGSIKKGDGSYYQVFTPYYRAWSNLLPNLAVAKRLEFRWSHLSHQGGYPTYLSEVVPDPLAGETKEHRRLEEFCTSKIDRYESERDLPAKDSTSRLSAALHFGVLHPRTVVAHVDPFRHERFLSEICWRDFYAETLNQFPQSSWMNLNKAFDAMETESSDSDAYERWVKGETGFPIVDAGMRQLASEGYMHNRVRMITASFLVKDLHIHWTAGARYFFSALVDGDVASNSHGWQWVAGTGRDAAPYYRIFNPVAQSKKFDPNGEYIRRYVLELREVPDSYIHEPWLYDRFDTLGYPYPMVDHQKERAEALFRFEATKRRPS